MELVTTRADVGARIDAALDLTTRLPRTLAAIAAGTVDLARACTIAFHTRAMTDADAAPADEVLAAAAPGQRLDQLARKAAALELKLAPEAVAARKTLAPAGPAGRGAPGAVRRRLPVRPGAGHRDVIASKAYIDDIALSPPRLRPRRGHPRPTARPGPHRPNPGPQPPRPHQATGRHAVQARASGQPSPSR